MRSPGNRASARTNVRALTFGEGWKARVCGRIQWEYQAALPESCFCSQSLPSTKRETMKVTT